jgi:hypothetical protein
LGWKNGMAAATQTERRGDRRDTILDVARACFVAEGYGATSMSTIAGRLGGHALQLLPLQGGAVRRRHPPLM